MIELKNVTKYYPTPNGRKYVLRDVSITFPENANIGIIGRNGAGKSTLLRLLGGIDYPDSGTIATTQKISPPFGMSNALAPGLTGRDNAKFACRVHGDSRKRMKRRVEFIKTFSELGNYFDMPVKSYSSGMHARLAFSISMAFDYDYYLIDELTSVGDQKFRKKAADAFAQKRGKASIILVSHNLGMHKKECDVVVYVHDSKAIFYEDVQAGIEAYLSAEG